MSGTHHGSAASAATGFAGSAKPEEGFFGWVTQLVHAHRARLARIVQREGVHANDALDCVQEAFLNLLIQP